MSVPRYRVQSTQSTEYSTLQYRPYIRQPQPQPQPNPRGESKPRSGISFTPLDEISPSPDPRHIINTVSQSPSHPVTHGGSVGVRQANGDPNTSNPTDPINYHLPEVYRRKESNHAPGTRKGSIRCGSTGSTLTGGLKA